MNNVDENIFPIFTADFLRKRVEDKNLNEIKIKFNHNLYALFSGYTRPNNRILYLLEFVDKEGDLKISMIFFEKIFFSKSCLSNEKTFDKFSREDFYELILSYRDKNISAHQLLMDIFIWNHQYISE